MFSCCALFSSEDLAGDTEHLKALDVSGAGDRRELFSQHVCTRFEMAPAAAAAAAAAVCSFALAASFSKPRDWRAPCN